MFLSSPLGGWVEALVPLLSLHWSPGPNLPAVALLPLEHLALLLQPQSDSVSERGLTWSLYK